MTTLYIDATKDTDTRLRNSLLDTRLLNCYASTKHSHSIFLLAGNTRIRYTSKGLDFLLPAPEALFFILYDPLVPHDGVGDVLHQPKTFPHQFVTFDKWPR